MEMHSIVPFTFRNPHPDNKLVGDCVKRAICIAEESDYREVSRELNRIKRDLNCTSYNNVKVWKEYMNIHRYFREVFQATKGCSRMNGWSFTDTHKKGTYILSMARHLTVCIDGIIYDTWNCLDKCVYAAYKVK